MFERGKVAGRDGCARVGVVVSHAIRNTEESQHSAGVLTGCFVACSRCFPKTVVVSMSSLDAVMIDLYVSEAGGLRSRPVQERECRLVFGAVRALGLRPVPTSKHRAHALLDPPQGTYS
jgi:hypothetical protein